MDSLDSPSFCTVDPNMVSPPDSSASSSALRSGIDTRSSYFDKLFFTTPAVGEITGDAGGESGKEAGAVVYVPSLESLIEPWLDIS
jgi:hypothetical protein